jgi:hypothetical protein
MLKTLTFALALGTFTTLLAVDAGALPLAQAAQAATSSDVVLVREGCGPGRRWSERRHHCVANGPVGRIIRDAARPCGPRHHWSVRRGRCVWN